jgi:Uri superfamily endonuclease
MKPPRLFDPQTPLIIPQQVIAGKMGRERSVSSPRSSTKRENPALVRHVALPYTPDMGHTMDPGTYVLIIALEEGKVLRIGRLGVFHFAPGLYLYVGSALNGLEARLARHQRATKRLHWHIDYLLPPGRLVATWLHRGSERLECCWARALSSAPGVTPSAMPFGASDCTCHTHLFHCQVLPEPHSVLRDFIVVEGSVG